MTDEYTLGAYRLIAELGHGGMADVYLAAIEGPTGSGFTKLAVVKKLRSHLAEDPEFVSMLMDEARITARLTHQNVIQLFELGHFDGQYFLAMEYLEGQPFHRVLQRVGRLAPDLPREVFYAVVSDVLAGLHHAHELKDYDGTPLQVVHRDVTPHNVFVTYDGVVKVVDFGIAKAAGRATETRLGIVKGKVRYMSPEQAAGRDADRRTDIFAAGVMLWNAATGMKLWGSHDDVSIARALHTGEYQPSPRAACPDVPEAIDHICRRALAFRREDRYETAAEMRADIERYLGASSADARKLLASTMKDAFARERAKVRAVLEASALVRPAAVAMLRGASATPAIPVDIDDVVPLFMESPAPVAAPSGPPSVAPFAFPTPAESRPVASFADAASSRKAPGARSTLGRAARAVAIAASAAAAVLVVVGATALGARSPNGAGAGHAVTAQPATLASELTSSSGTARAKVRRTGAEKAAAEKTSSRSRRSHARGAASSPANETITVPDAPEAEPASKPKAAGEAPKPRSGKLLDNADPWAGEGR